jgi:hypothetical protein
VSGASWWWKGESHTLILVNTFSIFASVAASYMLAFSLTLSQIFGVLPDGVFREE